MTVKATRVTAVSAESIGADPMADSLKIIQQLHIGPTHRIVFATEQAASVGPTNSTFRQV